MNNFNPKDIRGRKVNPSDKNFQRVLAGHKLTRKLLLTSLGITATSLASIIAVISGILLVIHIEFAIKKSYAFMLWEIALLIYYIATQAIIIIYGFELKLIAIITPTIISTIIVAFFKNKPDILLAVSFLGLNIALAWVGAVITAFFVAFTAMCFRTKGESLALFGAGLTATVLSLCAIIIAPNNISIVLIESNEDIVTLIVAFSVIITGAIIARQSVKGARKFAWIREKAIFFAAIGGTSFYGADLIDACFDGADLPHTDFRKATLTRSSFKDVTGLELSRLQGTILEQPNVRKLLITKRGYEKDYTGANLNGANLRDADLTGAILSEVQALDADFSGATLTDACIQDWNINKNTRFKGVICKRIYLKCAREGDRIILSEPKPDSGEFQPGEFEKWITDAQNTIDLIFQNGLNWRAFAFSVTQTAINNNGLGLSVQSIENKGDGVVVSKLGVPLGTNKAAIHEEITNYYNNAVKAIEGKYQLVLEAKDGEIERLKIFYESQQRFIQGLITGIAEPKEKVLIQGEGNRVYMMNQAGDIMESQNQNITAGGNVDMSSGAKVSAGRDISGSSLTLGDYNTQVGNTIQQLKDVSIDSSDKLAEILAALQQSITEDAALSESQKKEALEAVETIAEEGKKPPEERVLKLCSMAVNALKGITTTISDASRLAEILKTYLPTLTGLLGI